MRKYNISENLVRTIEQLYGKATSAVQMTVRMVQNKSRRKARMSSITHTLQHFFLERIIPDAPEEHDGNVSIGGRNIIGGLPMT